MMAQLRCQCATKELLICPKLHWIDSRLRLGLEPGDAILAEHNALAVRLARMRGSLATETCFSKRKTSGTARHA